MAHFFLHTQVSWSAVIVISAKNACMIKRLLNVCQPSAFCNISHNHHLYMFAFISNHIDHEISMECAWNIIVQCTLYIQINIIIHECISYDMDVSVWMVHIIGRKGRAGIPGIQTYIIHQLAILTRNEERRKQKKEERILTRSNNSSLSNWGEKKSSIFPK